MHIEEYIASQAAERQAVLKDIHAVIVAGDKAVHPVVEAMMGKEMLIYKANGHMKYGLAGVKKYMSLHVLPMYMCPNIYDKFKALLPKANFQKGCINFLSSADMPLPVVKQLITECAVVDLLKIRNDYLASKKTAKKK